MSKTVESVMGVEIFKWGKWDGSGVGSLLFSEVEFILPELQPFNESDASASLYLNGSMDIFDAEGELLKSVKIGQLESFREQLNKMYETVV